MPARIRPIHAHPRRCIGWSGSAVLGRGTTGHHTERGCCCTIDIRRASGRRTASISTTDNHSLSCPCHTVRTMPAFAQLLLPSAVLAASLTFSGLMAAAPVAGQPMAAVFPPWWSEADIFAATDRAGAMPLRFGAGPSTVIIPGGTSGLSMRLYRTGALLVLNAGERGGCLGGSAIGSSR